MHALLEPNNAIRPEQLPPLARKELREALRATAAAQQQLNRFVSFGI
jgi:Putative nucleotidyltransferase substrate binding domain